MVMIIIFLSILAIIETVLNIFLTASYEVIISTIILCIRKLIPSKFNELV